MEGHRGLIKLSVLPVPSLVKSSGFYRLYMVDLTTAIAIATEKADRGILLQPPPSPEGNNTA